jgi:glycosyl transferase family 25
LKTGKRKGHRSLTPGAIGCYLSHLNALQRVVDANKPMIICEDDAVFKPNSLYGIQSALKRVPYDENTMILFHIICTPENHVCTPLLTDPGVLNVESFWSLACYYVTPTVAKTLLRHAKPLRVQIDSYISDLRKENKLKIFSFPCVNTANFGTDIQAPIE